MTERVRDEVLCNEMLTEMSAAIDDRDAYALHVVARYMTGLPGWKTYDQLLNDLDLGYGADIANFVFGMSGGDELPVSTLLRQTYQESNKAVEQTIYPAKLQCDADGVWEFKPMWTEPIG